jgi:hypothetical protein
MKINRRRLSHLPLTQGLKLACSTVALTLALAVGSVQAARCALE